MRKNLRLFPRVGLVGLAGLVGRAAPHFVIPDCSGRKRPNSKKSGHNQYFEKLHAELLYIQQITHNTKERHQPAPP
jgi:hypothetical protein